MIATAGHMVDDFAAVAEGDEAAFGAIYRANVNWVYSLTFRILRDRSLAEDAVQETFVKVWRTAHRFDPKMGSARGWIGIIARNCALDLGRRRRPVEELDRGEAALIATEAIDPPDMKLGRCLSRLPSNQAKAIITMYTYGMSHSELSEYLGIPIGTVKSWISRGTSSLKLCMEG